MSTIDRLHSNWLEFFPEDDGVGPCFVIHGGSSAESVLAVECISEYAEMHGLSLYDIAEAVYFPCDEAHSMTRRDIARIVDRAFV